MRLPLPKLWNLGVKIRKSKINLIYTEEKEKKRGEKRRKIKLDTKEYIFIEKHTKKKEINKYSTTPLYYKSYEKRVYAENAK